MAKVVKKNLKIYVAMSGGVDSSVSAALLKADGYDVVGVYMKQWDPKILGKECMWKTDRQDAMLVCAKLGIPFLTWDFSKEYEKEVGQYMINSYKKGITPNPDVMCNKIIKFGLFFDKAMKEGADFIATGHYANTSLGNFYARQQSSASARPQRGLAQASAISRFAGPGKLPAGYASDLLPRSGKLLKAKDKNKDQTYFLYTISKKHLEKVIFPVGNLTKPEVRKLAKKFKLENAAKKDSQGVCFVGQFNMKEFLKMYIKPKTGPIVEQSSLRGKKNIRVVGQHDGVYYYTIGQRHGLNIKDGGGPYYVVKKDIKKNIIYVGQEKVLKTKETKIININWIDSPKTFPASVDVRIRHRGPLQKAKLSKNGELIFNKFERAIAPGQSAVFYRGDQVLGGGIIE